MHLWSLVPYLWESRWERFAIWHLHASRHQPTVPGQLLEKGTSNCMGHQHIDYLRGD